MTPARVFGGLLVIEKVQPSHSMTGPRTFGLAAIQTIEPAGNGSKITLIRDKADYYADDCPYGYLISLIEGAKP